MINGVQTAKRPKNKAEMKILISVDFGTTYSGLAYVETLNPTARAVIKDWGPGTPSADKAPTILQYDNGGTTGPFKWGFQVEAGIKRYEWFKLGLQPEFEASRSTLAKKYPSTSGYDHVGGETCEKMVVDYMTSLRQRALEFLKSAFGSALVNSTPIEYIITVPAIWTDKAQFKTRLCAQKAGMGDKDTIQIVSEPEAAGMHALESMPNLGLKVGDTFVVCDAGGGTVDLVSYTIKTLWPSPVVYETAPGSGGQCGSSFLNRIFAKYLEDKFRGYSKWFEDGYQSQVLEEFETTIKHQFVEDDEKEYKVMVRGFPEIASLGIRNRAFHISGKVLREEVFKPVISEVQRLVLDQITNTRENVTAVLLCGGFGQSDYLRMRLEHVVNRDIQIRKVVDSNTAIVRGALIRGLEGKANETRYPNTRVDSRMARKHFGTCCYEAYNEGKHDEARKEPHSYAGGHRVKIMQWFVNKGDSVKSEKPEKFEFFYDKRVKEGSLSTIDIEVLVCDEPNAPMYKNDTVKENVKLKIDLGTIPVELLNTEKGDDGYDYYKLDFDVEMALHSAKLTFALVYRGEKYESVQADFD